MVPKSDHLANTRFDKKPSAQAGAGYESGGEGRAAVKAAKSRPNSREEQPAVFSGKYPI